MRDWGLEYPLQFGQQGVVLLGAANSDAHGVGQRRFGKAADQDAPSGQGVGHLAPGPISKTAEAKIGLAGQRMHAWQGVQGGMQPLPLGDDALNRRPGMGHVVEGGQRGDDGRRVDIVGRSQPLHRPGDGRRGHGVSQPQPGHARPLAKGAQHDQIGVSLQQGHGALPAKLDVGLVHDDGQGELSRRRIVSSGIAWPSGFPGEVVKSSLGRASASAPPTSASMPATSSEKSSWRGTLSTRPW